ncbi:MULTISPECIES: aldo/keto reductase [Caproicibacterium]|jgi:predicted aldo/keto reductase-like oxidoreductase|uniref:Aldo/keto reductase n=1 Tax=Caproicibacterium lactatifermentans TaxID=2666138 RepID=A0A859DNQ3_9FIRM|nr:aldo/keto reductase [Caproicibacterium lactatifermentans]ARP50629.1 Fe-S oxidoreductase [Ruminococcaceae bacterium CPB6]MDD4807257.1 aldo/keto reductase [Oscillospiraceae bacterium]QKN23637.1 aldo/keto reductase [Caproicibacterium lactatifermentans]QKO29690.1 aldo/keto reductase [Caproicibacterium lactatifermentans]
MISRGYRNTDAHPSLLGFGTMRLPRLQSDKPEIDVPRAQELIDYAYAHGVNYYDTAYMYHDGLSEEFIGQALRKYPRESYFLADKMPAWSMTDQSQVDKIFQTQLVRCGVSYFDFYLCHGLDRHMLEKFRKFHILDYLKQKKAEGTIRQLGFSFHDTPEVLEQILEAYDWDFAQIQLNYFDWIAQNAEKQYRLLAERGIPVVVMEPVRGGALAALCPAAEKLLKAAEPQASLASWAIRFVASLPGVMTMLSGMNSAEQVRDNVQLLSDFHPLTADERRTLGQAVDLYRAYLTIPCTGCRYCMECPSGVEIPTLFRLYNEYKVSHRETDFLTAYKALTEKQRASACIGCGNCAQHCPQHIDIPAKMKEICATIEKILND